MTIIFIDTLGGVKYPEVNKRLPKKNGTGYFYEEFGLLPKSQIEEDLARTFLRIQGLWDKGHNFTDTHRAKAIKIAAVLNKIAGGKGGRMFYSPFCEHRKDAVYMSKLLGEIRAKFPALEPVNSPISGGQWVDGFVNEIHHNDKPAGMPKGKFIYSMDGLHQLDCDIEKHKKFIENPNCIAFGCWALQDNCKPNSKPESNKPPKLRKCKPTVDLHTAMLFQVENRKQKVSLPKGWLYKAYAEQHQDIDPRANKPVILTPKGKRFNQVTLAGIKLTKSGSTDGRQVWRCNQWGYKIGRKVDIKADGKLIGTVDAAWRENEYREKT